MSKKDHVGRKKAIPTEMRRELSPDETELLALTDSTLAKLRAMTDADFDALELYPDFDE